ncbi:MAG TPA: hypothetical protein VKX49_07115 [Bryobacteraceae bacterium]|nr:hypothetical protein [Bryobacteraceae bacterium]
MPRLGLFVFCAALLAWSARAQEPSDQAQPREDQQRIQKHKGNGAAKDVGSGAGDVGKGAAKGAGDAAKGVGKGAADLATLHPIDAAGDLGRGAVSTGKDVTVGTAKGGGKIVRGVGKALKKIF